MHFVKVEKIDKSFDLDKARNVAIEALETAYSFADAKVKDEIKEAIEKAEKVEPSPYYNPERSRKQIDELKTKE